MIEPPRHALTVGFSEELARRVRSLASAQQPQAAVQTAKRAIADTIGVALAGCRLDFVRSIARVVGADRGGGSSTVLGEAGKTTALNAALVNGVAAHALDYDDASQLMGGHPSAPIVPAILALAEERDSSGTDVVEAFISGFETETHLARAVMPAHYETGWHPTATLGLFGATAACGRLAGLNENALANAFSISVSLASGVKANFGTPVKPLHVGRAAQSGLFSVLLAEAGMAANTAAFEHENGFFHLFNGHEETHPERGLACWETGLNILQPGISVKQHPCCGSTHSAIDAAVRILSRHGAIDPRAVKSIEIGMHERRLAHTNRPDPKTGLEAKFSVQFLVCKALLGGAIRLGDFSDESFITPDIGALMKRVKTTAHTDNDEYLARVRIRLVDGRVLEDNASTPLGRGAGHPMSDGEIEAKFLDCTKGALAEPAARSLLKNLMNLEKVGNMDKITACLRRGLVTR